MRAYKVKTIRALERGLDVLAILQKSHAASLHDLYRETGLPKATLIRVLVTLEKKGLIWQRLADDAFLPSYQVRERQPHLSNEDYLVEVASPIMGELCVKVDWPSILAVPRLEHMEVIETNRPKSYFHHIALGPIGFRVNMLRSATGRAYLAFCSASEREATLERLKNSHDPGNFLARRHGMVEQILAETRALGYGTRYHDYGGHYDSSRNIIDDGRNSIALPISVEGDVIAVMNLTWINKVTDVEKIVQLHLAELKQAASRVAGLLA